MKNKKSKIKTGDMVKIVAGKDKGREGKVEKVFPKKNSVLITGVNLYKKHVKGNQGGVKAGIYDIPRPLNVAKVSLVCPNCKKIIRVGFEKMPAQGGSALGGKNRYCKKCKKKI